MSQIASGTKCAHCGEREATVHWVGDSGALGFIHGCWEPWCHRCTVVAQIDHCRSMAEQLPELETQLAAIDEATP